MASTKCRAGGLSSALSGPRLCIHSSQGWGWPCWPARQNKIDILPGPPGKHHGTKGIRLGIEHVPSSQLNTRIPPGVSCPDFPPVEKILAKIIDVLLVDKLTHSTLVEVGLLVVPGRYQSLKIGYSAVRKGTHDPDFPTSDKSVLGNLSAQPLGSLQAHLVRCERRRLEAKPPTYTARLRTRNSSCRADS